MFPALNQGAGNLFFQKIRGWGSLCGGKTAAQKKEKRNSEKSPATDGRKGNFAAAARFRILKTVPFF